MEDKRRVERSCRRGVGIWGEGWVGVSVGGWVVVDLNGCEYKE